MAAKVVKSDDKGKPQRPLSLRDIKARHPGKLEVIEYPAYAAPRRLPGFRIFFPGRITLAAIVLGLAAGAVNYAAGWGWGKEILTVVIQALLFDITAYPIARLFWTTLRRGPDRCKLEFVRVLGERLESGAFKRALVFANGALLFGRGVHFLAIRRKDSRPLLLSAEGARAEAGADAVALTAPGREGPVWACDTEKKAAADAGAKAIRAALKRVAPVAAEARPTP